MVVLEFHEDGNTIWVHGLRGTVLRVKTMEKIVSTRCRNQDQSSHGDVVTLEDIHVCVSDEVDSGSSG